MISLLALMFLYLYLPPVMASLWKLFRWNLLVFVLFLTGIALWLKLTLPVRLFFSYSPFFIFLAFLLGFLGEGGEIFSNFCQRSSWLFPTICFICFSGISLSLLWPLLTSRRKEEKKVVPISHPKQIALSPRKKAQPQVVSSSEQIYSLPPIDLLKKPSQDSGKVPRRETRNIAQMLEQLLKGFGVEAKVVNIEVGPAITRYELMLEPGIRVAKVLSLTDDIALALGSPGIRIETPVPNKPLIGIEVPLETISTVYLREIIESEEYKKIQTKLPLALGKDIGGHPVVADLRNMPHLLIAGATG
ncbi:MAG: DNA translocase FtsK, partial [bacterium]